MFCYFHKKTQGGKAGGLHDVRRSQAESAALLHGGGWMLESVSAQAQAGQNNLSCCSLSFNPSSQTNHPVQKGFIGSRADLQFDLIGMNPCPLS
jgi:hypothetical protein